MKQITKIIFSLRKQWKKQGFTPFEINNGNCDIFADEIAQKIPKAKTTATDYVNMDEFTHWYVKYKGKFFDAECPYGVKDYLKLPTFKREKIEKGDIINAFIPPVK